MSRSAVFTVLRGALTPQGIARCVPRASAGNSWFSTLTSSLPSKRSLNPRLLTREDLVPLDQYLAERAELRKIRRPLMEKRRLNVGPDISVSFPNFDTLWFQVHEMLAIEKGGEQQIDDELEAYAPLVPKGNDAVAVMMIEVDDKERRQNILKRLVGVESRLSLSFNGNVITGVPIDEEDIDRTSHDGQKTSAVHFIRFTFTPEQAQDFKTAPQIMVSIDHKGYSHMTTCPEVLVASLREELD